MPIGTVAPQYYGKAKQLPYTGLALGLAEGGVT